MVRYNGLDTILKQCLVHHKSVFKMIHFKWFNKLFPLLHSMVHVSPFSTESNVKNAILKVLKITELYFV